MAVAALTRSPPPGGPSTHAPPSPPTFPAPGPNLVMDRHPFGSPLPSFRPSVSPGGQSRALISRCAIGVSREPAWPDTPNHHPFITVSIATPAQPCRAPRRQLNSPLLCCWVEGTKQVHRALPWGDTSPLHTKHKWRLL